MSVEHSVTVIFVAPKCYMVVLDRAAKYYQAAKMAAILTHHFYHHNGEQPGIVHIQTEDSKDGLCDITITLDRPYLNAINNIAFRAWEDLVRPKQTIGGIEQRVYDSRGIYMARFIKKGLEEELKNNYDLVKDPPAKPEKDGFYPDYFNPEHEPKNSTV